MRNSLWLMIVFSAAGAAFLLGYSLSSSTGVEPGFFQGADTGGYGAGAGGKAVEGVSAEDQEYYKSLLE